MSDEREEREGRRERALRLDFFIAIGALVISVLTTVTLIYQTHVISDQYAATIWPYLSVKDQVESNEERLTLTNDGLGPALVRSAQLTVDGKNLASWNDYLRMLSGRLPRGAEDQRRSQYRWAGHDDAAGRLAGTLRRALQLLSAHHGHHLAPYRSLILLLLPQQ